VYRGTVMNTDKLKDSSGNVMDDNVWEIKWDNDALSTLSVTCNK
jgi:hypothetical protein